MKNKLFELTRQEVKWTINKLVLVVSFGFFFGQVLGHSSAPSSSDIPGCMYPEACNYNSAATIDDGSCDFTSCVVLGCTIEDACNYNSQATKDDGTCEYYSCEILGCIYFISPNYNPFATLDDGSCYIIGNECPSDFNKDGVVATSDLLFFLAAFGEVCE